MSSQLVQIAGAIAILASFAAAQAGRLDIRSWPYLWLNAVGATALAANAWHEEQWGFFLLEGVWAIVAVWGIAARLRRRASSA
jgi:hypothetical protein